MSRKIKSTYVEYKNQGHAHAYCTALVRSKTTPCVSKSPAQDCSDPVYSQDSKITKTADLTFFVQAQEGRETLLKYYLQNAYSSGLKLQS